MIKINNIKINYPFGFEDYRDGVDISRETINQYIKECIGKTDNESHWYISSGNTKVIVLKDEYEGTTYYDVTVCKDYEEFQFEVKNNIC